MKLTVVKLYSASAAYLRRTAQALGDSLLRSGPAHQKRQRVIDGYLLQATRTGDKAVVSVLDTPAFIMLNGLTDAGNYQESPGEDGAGLYAKTTGPGSGFMLLRPMLSVALGRDMPTVRLGEDYEPLTAATHSPRWGDYYVAFTGSATDTGLNAYRSYDKFAVLFPPRTFADRSTVLHGMHLPLSLDSAWDSYATEHNVVEVHLLQPYLRPYHLKVNDPAGGYYEVDVEPPAAAPRADLTVIRTYGAHFSGLLGGRTTFGDSFDSMLSRARLAGALPLARTPAAIEYLQLTLPTTTALSIADAKMYGGTNDGGVVCPVLERITLGLDEDGAPVTSAAQPLFYLDLRDSPYARARPEIRNTTEPTESGMIPPWPSNTYRRNGVGAVMTMIADPEDPDYKYAVGVVSAGLVQNSAPSGDPVVLHGYNSVIAFMAPVDEYAPSTTYLQPPVENFGAPSGSYAERVQHAVDLGSLFYGMDSDGTTAVAIGGYLETTALFNSLYDRETPSAVSINFNVVVMTVAGATLVQRPLTAYAPMAVLSYDVVTFIGNGKFVFFVSTVVDVIDNAAYPGNDDFHFNLALAQYDLATDALSVVGVIHDDMYALGPDWTSNYVFANLVDAVNHTGRVSVIQHETADEDGNILKPAVLLASVGTGANRVHNMGATKISYDSGATWKTIANVGGMGATWVGGVTWTPKQE